MSSAVVDGMQVVLQRDLVAGAPGTSRHSRCALSPCSNSIAAAAHLASAAAARSAATQSRPPERGGAASEEAAAGQEQAPRTASPCVGRGDRSQGAHAQGTARCKRIPSAGRNAVCAVKNVGTLARTDVVQCVRNVHLKWFCLSRQNTCFRRRRKLIPDSGPRETRRTKKNTFLGHVISLCFPMFP